MKSGFYLPLMVAIVVMSGCGRDNSTTTSDNQPVTGREVKDRVADAAETTKAYVVQGKDEFLAATEKKMKDLDAKMAGLNAKAADLKDDARVQADQAMADLRSQRDAAAKKYDELKAAGQDNWERAKAGFADAWGGVETAYTNAKAKFSN